MAEKVKLVIPVLEKYPSVSVFQGEAVIWSLGMEITLLGKSRVDIGEVWRLLFLGDVPAVMDGSEIVLKRISAIGIREEIDYYVLTASFKYHPS